MHNIKKALLIYLMLFFITGCGDGGPNVETIKKVSIELNGDSLMHGLKLDTSIPKYIKINNPQWSIDDRGVSGLTMKLLDLGYKEPYLDAPISDYPRGPQLPFSDEKHLSDIVVIELGVNDAYIQVPVDEYNEHLTSVVNTILIQNKIPVLVTIPQFSTNGVFNDSTKKTSELMNTIIRKIALEKSIALVELDKIPFNINDTTDGVHRTQIASNIFADLIANKIRSLVSKQ